MPVVSIPLHLLSDIVGREFDPNEMVELLGELGCDVEMIDPVTRTLKLALLPGRPDMFDPWGLGRCIRGYLKIETGLKTYGFKDSGITVRVEPGLERVRRFIACAVVEDLRLDEERVALLMQMQEALHWGLGRDRRRASIGIYDLDTVRPDFTYRPVTPDGVRFVPLGDERTALTPAEILREHPKGKEYRHLLLGYPVYPLLADREGRVLSMPPIINSAETKVTTRTRRLFIDITGPDEWAVQKCLAVVAAAFADMGGAVQRVRVVYPDGRGTVTPDMSPERVEVGLRDAERVIGIPLAPEMARELLERMRYGVERAGADRFTVLVPAYRSDVLHPWDTVEDIAIAYGYERLPRRLIPTVTASQPLKIEEFSQLCRRVLVGLGFVETMSLVLTSPEAHLDRLEMEDDGRTVLVENPVTVDRRMLRRHLRSGLLDAFALNLTQPLPQEIFEIGDVFQIQPDAETGAEARRHLAVGIADAKAGFAEIKAVVEALARELDLMPVFAPAEQPMFIPGRCAAVRTASGAELGILGEVHPRVLERFGLLVPVVLAEIDISRLLEPGGA